MSAPRGPLPARRMAAHRVVIAAAALPAFATALVVCRRTDTAAGPRAAEAA